MKNHVIAAVGCLLLLGFAGGAAAQPQDAKDCKDHPMFSRMRGFVIYECKVSAFDSVEVYTADGVKTVEGKKTEINYTLPEGVQAPTTLQIRRNYGNAVKSLGGTVAYDQERYLTGKVAKDGKQAWLKLDVFSEGKEYTLVIVEIAAMEQEVTANDMLDALNKNGSIALYINFDTGKADIKPESAGIIDQIVSLLKDNPALNVSVDGHTDNVGTAQSNKVLSEQRAKAVVAAVVKGGVPASRLAARGWGQDKPLADNGTEDGRAKNRRVEIVKK